jgi:hypothetical protein
MMKKRKFTRLPAHSRRKLNDDEVDWDEVDRAYTDKEKLEAETKLMKDWVRGNDDFNSAALLTRWRKMERKHRSDLLDLVINIFSIADSALEANNVLRYGMKMERASLDLGVINSVLSKMFVVRATEMFAEKAGINSTLRKELMTRAIAREFPLKDNRPAERAVATVDYPPQSPPIVRKGPTFTGIAPSKFGRRRSSKPTDNEEEADEK